MKQLQIFLILFLVVSIYSENILLNKRVLGAMKDIEKLNDGIINSKNYAVMENTDQKSTFFITGGGQSLYIDKISIALCSDTIPSYINIYKSSDIVNWIKLAVIKKKDKNVIKQEKDGYTKFTLTIKPVNALFLKFEFPKEKTLKSIRVIEVQAEKKENLEFTLSPIKIKKVTEHSITINWKTSIDTQSVIRINKNINQLKNKIFHPVFSTEHQAMLGELLKGTDYYIQVVAIDPNQKRIVSPIIKARTKGIPLPLITGTLVTNIQKRSIEIKWRANVPVRCELKYGLTRDYELGTYKDDILEKEHCIKLSGFQPDTHFYYRIFAEDRFGNKTAFNPIITKTKEENLALNKPVEGTFNNDFPSKHVKKIENPIQRAVDGNINVIGGAVLSKDVNKGGQFLIVDFQKESSLSKISVYWWGIAWPSSYGLYYSIDKKKWTILKLPVVASKGKEMRSRGDTGDIINLVETKCNIPQARYIKLYIPMLTSLGSFNKVYEPKKYAYLIEIKAFPIIKKTKLIIKSKRVY